jgi:hypothetical protein
MTLLLLLVVGLASMTVVAAVSSGTAATTPALAAAGEPPCSCVVKCPCGCSPLAGAWVARLVLPTDKSSSWEETIIQTFKFAPINEGCSKLVVNSQATTRPEKVAKFWPEACDQTEFVGVACEDDWKDMKFTAISYGVQRCAYTLLLGREATTCLPTKDKIQFIAVMTGRIELPESCLDCGSSDQSDGNYPNGDGKSSNTDGESSTPDGTYTGECKEPKELPAQIFVAYFDAAQDADHDGFPDCSCDEAVLCLKFEACLKRVEQVAPCDTESKSFAACLAACEGVETSASGKAFIKVDEEEQDVDVVVTVKNIKDVRKAALQIDGQDVLIVFTSSKSDTCDGLLVCEEFTAKDLKGGKKLADLCRALEAGRVTVVVSTAEHSNGEICGPVEDP